MLTFKTYLFETLDSIVPFTWVYQDEQTWKAIFSINDLKYAVVIGQDEENSVVWDVTFFLINRPDNIKNIYDLTGTGNAFLVLSTVVDILKEFVTKNKDAVYKIIFTAKEPSRQRVYDRMVRILSKSLPGTWSITILPKTVRKYILKKEV